jgi:hypothetical protein
MRKEIPQNRPLRVTLLLLGLLLPFVAVRAQWTVQDSLRLDEILNSDQEILINQDAAKSIQLDIIPLPSANGKPAMATHKPWMEFIEDLPTLYEDTTRYRRPQHIRMLPFSCFTRWNENPFALQDKLTKEKKWKMHWQLSKHRINGYDPRHGVPVGLDPDVAPGHSSGVGVMATFSADKLLYENFTKRGRAIKRNRAHANAWKTYQDYTPSLQDSLLFYKKLRRELNDEDSTAN